jgi:ethanolamine ammonia-lyase small subunit
MERSKHPVTTNPWEELRALTDARIALGRAGVSQPTAPQLAFQAAHAQARDAVHLRLDSDALTAELNGLGLHVLPLHSAATDRLVYLQRPDLGRRLDADSAQRLQAWTEGAEPSTCGLHLAQAGRPARNLCVAPPAAMDGRRVDVAVCLADGLSALALQRQAVPLLQAMLPLLEATQVNLAPLMLVQQARVALGDQVGQCCGARLVLVLIGERPGLSSPDSLGAYLTWMPAVGLTDAARNCVSNIRAAGLPPAAAARRLAWLMKQAATRQVSGVMLKDESSPVEWLTSPSALLAATDGPH